MNLLSCCLGMKKLQLSNFDNSNDQLCLSQMEVCVLVGTIKLKYHPLHQQQVIIKDRHHFSLIKLGVYNVTLVIWKVDRKPDQYAERALLVWSPTNEIMDSKCKLMKLKKKIVTEEFK